MTTAEKIYKTAQVLPEPVLVELLDFAEYLLQKQALKALQKDNIAQRINRCVKDLNVDQLPVPPRQLSRTPPKFDD